MMTNNLELLYNEDAEKSLIGSVIIEPSNYQTANISEEHFFIKRNGIIWKAVGNLLKKGISVDIETLIDELDRTNELSKIGGSAYLANIIATVPFSTHAESYAQIIRDYYRRRNLLEISQKLAVSVYDKDSNLDDEITRIIDNISNNVFIQKGAEHWKKYLSDFYDDLDNRIKNPNNIWGIQTGLNDFDKITGGLQLGEMMLLSGMPGMGKSMLAMQMGVQMAKNHPGAIYSVEMPGVQMVRRIISSYSNVEVRKMKSGNVSDEEIENIIHAYEKLNNYNVYLSDSSHWTTSALRADLQRLKIKNKIKWFVFDYMFLAEDGAGMTETERTTYLSRQFKIICRQLSLAGIIIHSMRKPSNTNNRPEQYELRSSFQAAYDADLICFLHEFTPLNPEEQQIPENERQNLRSLSFGKGRELENPKKIIHLVKKPTIPMFGDLKT